ncbi:ATP-binding protein [Cellvibrio sp. PSBB023]|uniref:ATP-binding protein n=1 Tax=Cellvibrio sp. PSBB023 TaxID=1945512 RepID=UPI00122E0DAF|nr:ATP-binding protein [Cellvibrio sp. PSBB023]
MPRKVKHHMPNTYTRIANHPAWMAKLFRVLSLVNPTLFSAVLAIALLIFSTLFALRHVHNMQERIVREHLQSSLNSFTELINVWQQQNLAAIHMLANSVQGRMLLKQVLQEQGDNPATHLALREWLYPVLMVMGFDGYSVMNNERVLVAASSESYHKQPVRMVETHEVLDKALAQQPAISRPVAAARPLNGPRGSQPAGTLMQNMCISFETDVTRPGYFCLRFNTQSSFFPIFYNGRSGSTGEIYAIDRRGIFVTPPRFSAAKNGDPIMADELSLQGTQSPLTRMVDFLINRQGGFVSLDYADYRGTRVAGAGRWLDEMELGIIVEQDLQEAMSPYLASRNIILALSLGASVLIVLLTVTAIINRRRLVSREGRFRSLLDNLPPPIHMTSPDNKITVVNPAFCELVGLDKADLLGRDIDTLPLPPWLRPLFDAERTLGTDSYRKDFVAEVVDAEGMPRYYRIVRFPVVYKHKQAPQAIASVWVDSTERVVAGQQLAQVNQNLELLVNERTHELMMAKDEALAASQTKADFLANMSHEIRTPLNAIIGLAHVALASGPEPRLRTYLEKMRGSGEHLLQIINDILNFSRMEAGKLTLDNSPFAIDQLVDKTLDLVFEKAAAKGLLLRAEVDPTIPKPLLGDELRLGQILINFCANAVKFTDQGRVTLRVTLVRDWPEQVELLFEVEDTGIGIAADEQPKLFQPFEQVDTSSARRFEGTGLGLSICKNLAELMQAHIDVKSTLGQGSCFRLRVTLDKQVHIAAMETPVEQPAEQPLPERCPVLVVEDNLLNQEIIQTMLTAMGVQVTCVGSGPEAIAAVQKQGFALIFMDIQLPGMDGVEAAARIRTLAAGTFIPIVAVTANALPGDREAYLAAGMDDYLAKPIEPAQLQSVLLRWGQAQHQVVPLVAAANPFDILRRGGIDTARALHNLMHNEALYRRLLERFASERSNLVAGLADLVAHDPVDALNQVHSLKSLAGSLGMNRLEQVAQQLEQLLRDGSDDQTALPNACRTLSDELQAMIELVRLGLPLAVPSAG